MRIEPATLKQRLGKLVGDPVERDLSALIGQVGAIARREPELETLSDEALSAETRALRSSSADSRPQGGEVATAFAVVREVARRVLGERLYDEQVLAGLVMREGKLAELATGEGKTLAAVAPVFLGALSGKGVHVLAFNDYLAERDARWMGPVYRRLGVSVGFVREGMTPAQRRAAYQEDVTYVTAKEAGFDFLRDQLCLDPAELVHRPFHMALVDEADSILVDEARIPLVIAGNRASEQPELSNLAELARSLERGRHFDTDDHAHNIFLTDPGIERVEEALGCGPLYATEGVDVLADVHNALHAQHLLHRDVDYIVRDGKIELVDETTGRVAENRHWPDGLQAAIESKEGVELQGEGRILGSITLQHLLQMYPHLCGMTATAQSSAEELKQIYDLSVAVIPTHSPGIRDDQPDVVFTHAEAKRDALVAEIQRVYGSGRPILVGTVSVADSEGLAERLAASGVKCQVLNAKNDAREADIVAEAATLGAVTISTNMAGRGVDIRLGGPDGAQRQEVLALGGLYVIGTNRHESRRVDRQLRGRAGRQGDPGTSRFFVSLQDDLLVLFGVENFITARHLPEPQREPIDIPLVRREIARAQRVVESESFEVRKNLWNFSSIVETQRKSLFEHRGDVLHARVELDLLSRRCAERHATFREQHGEQMTASIEKRLTLLAIDRHWSEHLAEARRLREEMPLVTFVRKVPLAEFIRGLAHRFVEIQARIEDDVVGGFEALSLEEVSLDSEGLRGPSATWTYLVSDDPYGSNPLTGLGSAATGMWAAFALWPLLLVSGLYARWKNRRRQSST